MITIRIDHYHHVVPEPDVVSALTGLSADVRQLYDLVTEIRMRDEVPQEVADAIGDVQRNVADNFVPGTTPSTNPRTKET